MEQKGSDSIKDKYYILKRYRDALGINQQDMADKLKRHKSTYARMENGVIPFPMKDAKTARDYINEELVNVGSEPVTLDVLFFTDSVPNTEQKE